MLNRKDFDDSPRKIGQAIEISPRRTRRRM